MRKKDLKSNLNGFSTNINLLRFLAAILVIYSHSYALSKNIEDPLSRFSNGQISFGGLSVGFFFFLSGLYVAKSMYKDKGVKIFLRKRCVRILPQLWIVVIICVFIMGPIITNVSIKEYFLNIQVYKYLFNGCFIPIHDLPGVFTNNIYGSTVNGPLWTLPVEMVAYIGLAVILFLSLHTPTEQRMQKILHIIALCVAFLIFVGVSYILKNDFLITVIRPVVLFFLGVLYCDWSDKIVLDFRLAILLIVVFFVSLKFGFANYALFLCMPYCVLTFALGLPQVSLHASVLNTSYEMYLIGWPIQQWVVKLFGGEMNPILNFLLAIPIDVVIAVVLYKLTEIILNKFMGEVPR